jgi:predicted nuclease of predicted toxin-antitoxin system
MRFLADMGVAQRIVIWLREAGHDAVHLREQNLQRLADSAIFEKAVTEKRILLTFDLDFGELVILSAGHPVGTVLFRLRNTRTPYVFTRLLEVLDESGDALQSGAIIVVEDSRHRVRRYPR